MSIPVIREVRYTDNGYTLYECLNCYQKIESRSGGFEFCPYCGCKFEYSFVSKKKEYRDCPEARTKRISVCNFILWMRYKNRSGTIFKWSDWQKQAEGPINYILDIRRNLQSDLSFEYELKITKKEE